MQMGGLFLSTFSTGLDVLDQGIAKVSLKVSRRANLLDDLEGHGHNAASSAAGGQTAGRTHFLHHLD
jgi:hypothetical protein